MKRWALFLLLVLALVAAAGCGGDDSAAVDETTTVEETTTDETTAETTTDAGETDTTDLSGILADEDCLALVGVGASIAQAYSGAAGGADAAELQALVDKVPEEIRADVQVLAEWYGEYAAKLEDIGLQAGETPTADQIQQLQAALASLDQAEVTAASERLSAWAEQNCPQG